MKEKEIKEYKAFNLRLPKDIWIFLKKESLRQEKSISAMIVECVEKLRERREKKVLTGNGTNV